MDCWLKGRYKIILFDFSKPVIYHEPMIKITLNGKQKELATALNLHDVIGQFCKDTHPVIAELNGHIIKKPIWNQISIKDGDTVELVSMVGGG
jgi:sulfur carrier protein